MSARSADFNAILTGANLLVLGLLLWALATTDGNRNVDQETIALGALLCLQTHAALWIERRKRDPFVILLADHSAHRVDVEIE